MNFLRTIFVYFMTSLVALTVNAAQISLNRSDFKSAKESRRHGDILISAELSETGISKVAELNKISVGKEVEINVGGENRSLKLREPIKGAKMEFGPFSEITAKKIVEEINTQK